MKPSTIQDIVDFVLGGQVQAQGNHSEKALPFLLRLAVVDYRNLCRLCSFPDDSSIWHVELPLGGLPTQPRLPCASHGLFQRVLIAFPCDVIWTLQSEVDADYFLY